MQTFGTDEYPSFEEAMRVFLKQAGEQSENISSCCLAVAGPVVDNKCAMTNLKWVVDGRALTQEFGFRTAVRFIDSLYTCMHLAAHALAMKPACSQYVYQYEHGVLTRPFYP